MRHPALSATQADRICAQRKLVCTPRIMFALTDLMSTMFARTRGGEHIAVAASIIALTGTLAGA